MQDTPNKNLLTTALRHPLELAICSLLVGLVIITLSQVVWRYVFESSLSWSEELARFFLIWLTMLSAAYGVKTRAHFALTLVVNKLSPTIQRYLQIAILIIASAFLILFTYQAAVYTLSFADTYSPALQVSMAFPYSSSVVGGSLMAYYFIKTGLEDLSKTSINQPKA